MNTRYAALKKLVEQKQGCIHPEILALSEEEQILLFEEALAEGVIVGKKELEKAEEDLKERIALAKKIASMMV
jgi:hypothetical protein